MFEWESRKRYYIKAYHDAIVNAISILKRASEGKKNAIEEECMGDRKKNWRKKEICRIEQPTSTNINWISWLVWESREEKKGDDNHNKYLPEIIVQMQMDVYMMVYTGARLCECVNLKPFA